MKSYVFKQLGTFNIVTLEAQTVDQAKMSAAEHFNCRTSSCFNVREDGKVMVFVGINEEKSQKLIIKADDVQSARQELVFSTNSKSEDWDIIDFYSVDENATRDIQYETIH